MGKLTEIIRKYVDAQPFEVSDRQVAQKLGVTQTTLSNWGKPTKLIQKRHLVAISRLTGAPYSRVLDALLEDIGYLHEDGDGSEHSAAPMTQPGSRPGKVRKITPKHQNVLDEAMPDPIAARTGSGRTAGQQYRDSIEDAGQESQDSGDMEPS